MPADPFADRARFDARDKVLGRTAYTADIKMPGLLHAMQVPATIAKGGVIRVDTADALRVPGVVRILTAADFPTLLPPPPGAKGPAAAPAIPTITAQVAYRGAPVALVVAETIEAAIEAAEAVRPIYAPAPSFSPLITSACAQREPAEPVDAGDGRQSSTWSMNVPPSTIIPSSCCRRPRSGSAGG